MEADDQNGIVENQHDAAGQLTGRFRGQVPLEEYRYDDVGNLYPRGQARTYGPGGRLEQVDRTTYVYDERARLIEKTTIGDDGDERRWTYSWNGKGLLHAVVTPDGARTEFVYDCFARRVSKRSFGGDGRLEKTTRFVWDGDHVVHEIVVTEATGAREVHTHCFGDDEIEILASRVQGGGVAEGWRSFVTAPNGFPDLVFGADGAIVARGERDAWGRTTTEPAELGPFRYAGQYADTETGLYYNRHRYYDPSIGRYINADPIETARSLRLFAYVDNDPYRWIDPDGLAYAEVTNHGITGRGYSKTSRTSSAPIHPVVENNLAQGKLVGEESSIYPSGNNNPLNCAEPAAMSHYLYQYEAANDMPPGSLQDESNRDLLAKALDGATVEAYPDDTKSRPMEACPNCGVLVDRLNEIAGARMTFDAYRVDSHHPRRERWDEGMAAYAAHPGPASVHPFDRAHRREPRAHRGPR
jgi:RHS repeat-associated protein